MSGWREAPDVPKSWEGFRAWKWSEWAPDMGVALERVPFGFSRVRHHCEGVYYWPVDPPLPPTNTPAKGGTE